MRAYIVKYFSGHCETLKRHRHYDWRKFGEKKKENICEGHTSVQGRGEGGLPDNKRDSLQDRVSRQVRDPLRDKVGSTYFQTGAR